jgi:DNA-binding NarL/FixJ family response regulator
MSIRVLLADDHAVVRDGLRLVLEANDDISVIGVAADGREAVRQCLQLRPDVAVLDIAMPELNGIEATRQIRAEQPATHVVILSMHSTTEHIVGALRAGAQAYLLKESAGIEVVQAVRAVHTGQRYLSRKITETIVEDYLHQLDEVARPLDRLTDREREVLQLVAEGKTSADIAEVLSISIKTVETYRSRIMHKLDLRDLPALVKFAIQQGLIPLE